MSEREDSNRDSCSVGNDGASSCSATRESGLRLDIVRGLLGLFLITVALTGGCSLSEGPGRIQVLFTWKDEPPSECWLWARVERRVDVHAMGEIRGDASPVHYRRDGGGASLQLGEIPNGTDLRVVVEARGGPDPDLDVLFYGISEPFTLSAGTRETVPVHLQMRAPRSSGLSSLGEAVAVRLVGPDGSETEPVSISLEQAHDVVVVTRSVGTAAVVLANDLTFSAGRARFEVASGDPHCTTVHSEDGTQQTQLCRFEGWDLLAGLGSEPHAGAVHQLAIYARFEDAFGYDSEPRSARVLLDREPPQVVGASIGDDVVGLGQVVTITVNLHERVLPGSQGADLVVLPEWAAPLVGLDGPVRVGSSNAYAWSVTLPSREDGGEALHGVSLEFLATLTDEQRNRSEILLWEQHSAGEHELPLVLAIDAVAPSLLADPAPDRWLFGVEAEPDCSDNRFAFDFVLGDENPVLDTDVSACRDSCPTVRLSGREMARGVVRRAPELDRRADGVQWFGFRYELPICLGDWGAIERSFDVRGNWTDEADNAAEFHFSNAMDATSLRLEIDLVPPSAVVRATPTLANAEEPVIVSLYAREPIDKANVGLRGRRVDIDPPQDFEFGTGAEIFQEGLTTQFVRDDLESGTYEFTATLRDRAGNTWTSEPPYPRTTVDRDAPGVLGSEDGTDLQPTVAPSRLLTEGDRLHVAFWVDEPLRTPPTVSFGAQDLGDPVEQEESEVRPGAVRYSYEYIVPPPSEGANGDGLFDFVISLQDRAGNRATDSTSLGAVQLDRVRPGVLEHSVTVRVEPPVDSLLRTPRRVTYGSTFSVTFTTTEELAALSATAVGAREIDLPPPTQLGGNGYEVRFSPRRDRAGGPLGEDEQGVYSVHLWMKDLAGNETRLVLLGTPVSEDLESGALECDLLPGRCGEDRLCGVRHCLDIDTLSPSAPSGEGQQARLLYRRAPWGTVSPVDEDYPFLPEYAVLAEPGAFEPNAWVYVWERLGASDTYVHAIREPVRSNALGGLDVENPAILTDSDRVQVYVSLVDDAGNESEKVLVRHGEWVSTMSRKVAGSIRENPAGLALSRVWRATPEDPSASVQQDYSELARAYESAGRESDFWFQGTVSWHARRSGIPTPRAGFAVALDSDRGRLVMHGGSRVEVRLEPTPHVDIVYFDDTWEWNPETGSWLERSPGEGESTPSRRANHQMVYDPMRKRTVLFGGYSLDGDQEIWEWDGIEGQWRHERPPELAPKALRAHHAMAYDSRRGRVVLFGGVYSHSFFDDMWERDGTTPSWNCRTPEPRPDAWPSRRWNHGLVYDAISDRFYVFGGETGGNTPYPSDELWAYSPGHGSWEDLTPWPRPAQWPSEWTGAAMAIDTRRGEVLLFGGLVAGDAIDGGCGVGSGTQGEGGACFSRDLWVWSQETETWTRRTAEDGESWPTPRAFARALYDAQRDSMYLVGGANANGDLSEIWVWEPSLGRWTNRTASEESPEARTDAAGAYASHSEVAVLYGGRSAERDLLADLWHWEGAAGHWTEHPRTVGGRWPGALSGARAVGVPDDAYVYLFGGCESEDENENCVAPSNQLWELDVRTWQWSEVLDSRTGDWPAARFAHAMAFDAARGRVVVHGGDSGRGTLADLWTWDLETHEWLRHDAPVGEGPPALAHHALAYDSRRDILLLLGGYSMTAVAPSAELYRWEPNENRWSCLLAEALWLDPISHHAMFYEPSRDVLVRVGGFNGERALQGPDAWSPRYWTDEVEVPWTHWGPAAGVGPPNRYAQTTVFDPRRSRALDFGGTNGQQTFGETWELDPGAGGRPAALWQVPWSESGAAEAEIVSVEAWLSVGGLGYELAEDGGRAIYGAVLHGYDEEAGRWRALERQSGSVDDSPAPLLWTAEDGDELRGLISGPQQRLRFAVTPAGPNGTGGVEDYVYAGEHDHRENLAYLELDYVELRVRHVWTDCRARAVGCAPGNLGCDQGSIVGIPCTDGDESTLEEQCVHGVCRVAPEFEFYRFVPQAASWDAAREHCAELLPGGDLAIVRDEHERDVIARLIGDTNWEVWLGGSYVDGVGMMWHDGTPTSYEAWLPDEPSDPEGTAILSASFTQISDGYAGSVAGLATYAWRAAPREEEHAYVCEAAPR